MSKDRKIEASVPVQGRIDLRTLATFALYWESEGYMIDSMSKLLSWTMDAFKEVLIHNKGGEIINVETLENACTILSERGLMNRTLMGRAEKKIALARGLENIRMDGWGVSRNNSAYRELHPHNQVSPFPGGEIRMTPEQRAENERRVKIYKEIEAKEMREEVERQKANAMKSGKVVVVEGEGETTAERNERLARENSRRIEEDDMMPPGYDEE